MKVGTVVAVFLPVSTSSLVASISALRGSVQDVQKSARVLRCNLRICWVFTGCKWLARPLHYGQKRQIRWPAKILDEGNYFPPGQPATLIVSGCRERGSASVAAKLY